MKFSCLEYCMTRPVHSIQRSYRNSAPDKNPSMIAGFNLACESTGPDASEMLATNRIAANRPPAAAVIFLTIRNFRQWQAATDAMSAFNSKFEGVAGLVSSSAERSLRSITSASGMGRTVAGCTEDIQFRCQPVLFSHGPSRTPSSVARVRSRPVGTLADWDRIRYRRRGRRSQASLIAPGH
jgi:hypothetical protein